METQALYQNKLKTIPEALKLIRSGDFIITPQVNSEPIQLLSELHTIRDNGVRGCELTNCLPMKNYEFMKNPLYADAIFTTSWFYAAGMRANHPLGHVSCVPQHAHSAFSRRESAIGDRRIVLFVTCSPMDKHGYLSLSLSCMYERDVINTRQKGREVLVIAEVHPNYPRTFGDTTIHVSQIDAIVQADYEPPAVGDVVYSDADHQIGQYIAELVEDGSTIQLGIGKMPNAVAVELKNHRHLGIHSEMFADNMIDLLECGAVDNSLKTQFPYYSVAAFAFGSKRLYQFIDDNPSVLLKTGSWTNDPYVIGRNFKQVAINATLEVDLNGQCASEAIGNRQYSGTGGQADFAIGAQISPGGKSIIALHSTAAVKQANGETTVVSKIVPQFKEGWIVSLSRNDNDYVVTEYGVAWLRGQSIRERVKRLINIAHPDFRDELRFAAKQYMMF